MNNQGYPQGFIVVRPFSGKPPVSKIIAIVGGVNDHRIIRKSLFF